MEVGKVSTSMGPLFALIFVVVLMICATVIVFASLLARYKQRGLQYRERLAALDKGAALPVLAEPVASPRPFEPRTYLLRGLVWLFVGTAIVISLGALAMGGSSAYNRVSQANFAKANGATDEQVRMIMNDRHSDGPGPGIALIGLIPMGVGLAYLITYRSERANRHKAPETEQA